MLTLKISCQVRCWSICNSSAICLALTAGIFYTSFADPIPIIPVSAVPEAITFPRRVSPVFPQQSQVCGRWERCLCGGEMSKSEQMSHAVFTEQLCCARSWSAVSAGAGGDGFSSVLAHWALIAWAAWQHLGTQYCKLGQIWIGFIEILCFWLQNSLLGNEDIFIWYLLYELVSFPFDFVPVLRIIYMGN